MGLFNFGSKEAIKLSAYKISTALEQINEELEKSNHQITPMIRGLATVIKDEVKVIETHLKPNGQTDWNLYNTLNVKVYGGEEVSFSIFESRVNSMSQSLERMTGITNMSELINKKDGITFRIWT